MAAAMALVLAIASPAAASPPERSSYQSSWAQANYASGLDPYADGLYWTLSVHYADWVARTAGNASAQNFVDIFASGWWNEGGVVFNDPWEGGYFVSSSPPDPTLGSIAPSLDEASAVAGPLTFVCYQGPCPSFFPETIYVSATWTASGPSEITASHPVDDLGGVSSMVVRLRPATVALEITGGSLALPSIESGATIHYQMQVYRGPKE